MKSKTKSLLVGCGAIVIGFVALVMAIGGYTIWRSRIARERARELCSRFPVGSEGSTFERTAEELGLRVIPAPPSAENKTAYDAALMARYFCTIELRANHVISAKTSFLD